jgi:hypothetical protein
MIVKSVLLQMTEPSVLSATRHFRYCYLKTALIIGLIYIDYERMRLHQKKDKNVVNLSQVSHISTQRVKLYLIKKYRTKILRVEV